MSQLTEAVIGRGGARPSQSWAVFGLVLLAHVSAAMVGRDYLTHKRPIPPPQPILVTLIDVEQASPAAPTSQRSAAQPLPAPRAQRPAPPQETPPPEPITRPPRPMAQPPAALPPHPQPPPEPAAAELPPPSPPVPPEAVAATAPAVAPAAQPALAASAPGPLQPPSPVAPASSKPAASSAAPAATSSAPSPPRVNAAYLDNPKPAYPLSARRMRLEGTVRLRVFVSAAGAVEQIEVQRTSGSPVLDRSALDAVKHWRFVPARHGEEAVPAWVVVPIVFTLRG